MINDDQLKDKLAASPSPARITPEFLQSKVASSEFTRLGGGTLTVCVLTTVNGYQLVGTSACADPVNYNQEIGEKVAFDNAFKQLWQLEGYVLKNNLWALSQGAAKAA